jgi:ABC-type lipoprotein release transport system permease subunit
VAIGAVAVIGAMWLLLQVFDVQNLGWPPFVFSGFIVAALAMAASLFPAWRAALLSPMVAIRDEPESIWESARQRIRRKP